MLTIHIYLSVFKLINVNHPGIRLSFKIHHFIIQVADVDSLIMKHVWLYSMGLEVRICKTWE